MSRAFRSLAWLLVSACSVTSALAQEVAGIDYEGVSFRGIGFEAGYLPADYVRGVSGETPTWSVRLDLGYLGPGFRLAPSVTYWSSELEDEKVRGLEVRLEELVAGELGSELPRVGVDLGRIVWTDISVGLDTHVVWNIPFGWLSFLGAGVSAHILDGQGEAIDGTLIEDLLDTVRPGVNLHAGLEYPLWRWSRLYVQGRYHVTDDLRYFNVRGGLQLMVGGTAPGEMEPR